VKILVILNDPPYGSERPYNALRLATALRRKPEVELKVFLMADAVSSAKGGQKVPEGYYSLQSMLRMLTSREVPVGACGTCMDARGLTEEDLVEGVHRSTMNELADWSVDADKVIVF
jgi:uncharacterized protein involved in oxidation of intracellular sulfur